MGYMKGRRWIPVAGERSARLARSSPAGVVIDGACGWHEDGSQEDTAWSV
jgi:hypothetical protein